MKTISINFVSDEHLDFYIGHPTGNKDKDRKRVRFFVESRLQPSKGDVFITAGDQGHYNSDIKIYLDIMKEYYEHVIIVPGNHNLYLISNSQRDKYNLQSENRLKEIQEYCDNDPVLHYLDGNVVNINGIKIGGYGNWYNLPTNGLIAQWNDVMNDSNLIYGGTEHNVIQYGYGAYEKYSNWDTQAFRKTQEESLQRIVDEKCDILVTHMCPSIIPDEYLDSYHVDSRNNIFYATDDFHEVKKTECSLVIYGHNHQIAEWSQEGIDFKTNAVGYPMEYQGNGIQYFDFIKD